MAYARKFDATQRNVRNHYPEQKIGIICVCIVMGGKFSFSAKDSDLAHCFLSHNELSEKKTTFKVKLQKWVCLGISDISSILPCIRNRDSNK